MEEKEEIMETMVKVILFDWFGVICNKAFAEWARKNAISELMFKELMSLAGRVDAGDLTLAKFREEVGKLVNQSPELVRWGIAKFTHVDEQMIELIRRLRKNYGIVVLSNINAEFLAEIIEREQLFGIFNVIFASSQMKLVKPDPAIFKKALDILCCHPHEVVFVDDIGSHVMVAESLGMKGIVFTSVRQLEQELEAVLVEQ